MTTGWALTGEPAQRRGTRSAGAPAAPPAEPGSRHGGSKGEAALTGRTLGIPVLGNRRQLRPKVGVVWDGGALPRQALWGLQATRPRGHQPRVGGRRRGTPGRRRDQGGEQPPEDGGRLRAWAAPAHTRPSPTPQCRRAPRRPRRQPGTGEAAARPAAPRGPRLEHLLLETRLRLPPQSAAPWDGTLHEDRSARRAQSTRPVTPADQHCCLSRQRPRPAPAHWGRLLRGPPGEHTRHVDTQALWPPGTRGVGADPEADAGAPQTQRGAPPSCCACHRLPAGLRALTAPPRPPGGTWPSCPSWSPRSGPRPLPPPVAHLSAWGPCLPVPALRPETPPSWSG